MKIISIRPAPPGAGANTLAYLDVAITDQVRLYNLTLRRNRAGRLRVAAPNALGVHTATFAPEFAESICRAADAALNRSRCRYEPAHQ